MQKENVPLRNSSKIGGLQNGLNTGKTGKTRIELPRVIYHIPNGYMMICDGCSIVPEHVAHDPYARHLVHKPMDRL